MRLWTDWNVSIADRDLPLSPRKPRMSAAGESGHRGPALGAAKRITKCQCGSKRLARPARLACSTLGATGSAAFEEGGGPVSGNTTAPTVHCKGYHD